ncbi:MAG TPA: signal recognition particle-docking protein FtsY [archaeon]|nr:signal recognition particle-docking protein FtsY [archaeon]
MFEFLKKKISGFTDKLKETIQGKQKAQEKQPSKPEEITQEPAQEQSLQAAEIKTDSEIIQPEKQEQTAQQAEEKPAVEKKAPKKEKHSKQTQAQEEKAEIQNEIHSEAALETELQAAEPEHDFQIGGEDRSAIEKVKEVREDEKRELKAKVGITKKLFGFLGGKIKISEGEIGNFFEEFELSLLESDVQQDAAEAIVKELKGRILGKEISAKEDATKFIKNEIRASLAKIMETNKVELLSMKGHPTKILFLGPNGAGKTTSIAKVSDYLMKKGKSVILAAGDTFRAASIEQLEEHANKLGVKMIKHKYGSDPAAVAFDAVKAAEAKGIDYVLIDTAGRQETNRNLIEELKKIERVVKPDLKIYVGEAYTGQALLQQATEFDKAIGIDGFILSKIDTDAKGGTAISLLYTLKKPILFVGTGQRYSDLLEFKPEFIIDRII